MYSFTDINKFSNDKLCRLYLIHSYLYYVLDNSVITDESFDCICKELLKRFKGLKNEKLGDIDLHKFITIDNLEAGTGYSLAFSELPKRVIDCAMILHTGRDFEGNKINLEDWIK